MRESAGDLEATGETGTSERDPILSADEALDISRAVAVGNEVVHLDEFWVREGRVAARPGQAERGRALATVGHELDKRLEEFQRLVPRFAEIVSARAPVVLKAVADGFFPEEMPERIPPDGGIGTSAGPTVTPEARAVLQRITAVSPEQLQATLMEAAEQVATQLGVEREVVQQAVGQLAQGITGGQDVSSVVQSVTATIFGPRAASSIAPLLGSTPSGSGGSGGGGIVSFIGCTIGSAFGQKLLGCAIGQLLEQVLEIEVSHIH
ncbi:MAG TPA: hypothetical protein VKB22_10555 [Gemmatimonadales bacterium]|nr:hypothetical protein [Gemmatimonadales bacterium]